MHSEAKMPRDNMVEGFITHELETEFPSVVLGEKDSVNEHTNEPVYQSVAHERLLPVVISALQHALQKIEVLEEKLG